MHHHLPLCLPWRRWTKVWIMKAWEAVKWPWRLGWNIPLKVNYEVVEIRNKTQVVNCKDQVSHVWIITFLWKYLRWFLGKLHQHLSSSPSWKHHPLSPFIYLFLLYCLVFISRTCGDWHLSNTHILTLKLRCVSLTWITYFSSLGMMTVLIMRNECFSKLYINNQTFTSQTVQNLLIPKHCILKSI